MQDAIDLQEAGCFSIVFEKIPAELAARVSSSLTIPTIGIGAGVDCDGQVLVLHDMLGMTQEFGPRFLEARPTSRTPLRPPSPVTYPMLKGNPSHRTTSRTDRAVA